MSSQGNLVMRTSLSKCGSLCGLFEGSNVRESDANNSENTVYFFPARDVDKRSARSGFEMAVDRIVEGIEAQTAYLIGVPYRVVGAPGSGGSGNDDAESGEEGEPRR